MRKESYPPASSVRFLHAVGQSTLRQGITVPLSAQVSWLANIKKGENVPVTIVFNKGRSVSASLRRLNNLQGHLQFRYESRQQAPLRDYLSDVFGERADCKNALLRIHFVHRERFIFGRDRSRKRRDLHGFDLEFAPDRFFDFEPLAAIAVR